MNDFPNQNTPENEAATREFVRLVEIVARLRAPDGCPWDREQTHLSLRRHLIEEAYETLDAIEKNDDANLCEELGDVMLQPVLHAQLASEENRFDIADVLQNINDKLVRRHPHIFGGVEVQNSAQVLANWETIKQQEKAQLPLPEQGQVLAGALGNVPRGLPSLLLALQISKKAARVGFEWPAFDGVLQKLREEIDELEVALGESPQRASEELGDLLFTVVNVARWHKIDPEIALRDMTLRFSKRFSHMENVAREQNLELEKLSPKQWDELWNAAKQKESNAP